MKKYLFNLLLLILIFNGLYYDCYSQQKFSIYSQQQLVNKYNTTDSFQEKIEIANFMVEKAKRNQDTLNEITGYYLLSTITDGDQKIQFLDSIIQLTKNGEFSHQPALSYNLKGAYYYEKEDLKTALNLFLKGYHSAKEKGNNELVRMSSYHIGLIRNHIGDYQNAYRMFILHYRSFESQDQQSENYLVSIYAMADIHNRLKNIDSSKYYTDMGMHLSKEINSEKMIDYFRLTRSQSQFLEQKIDSAISTLKLVIPAMRKYQDSSNLAESIYYLGECYWIKGEKTRAIDKFKIIDTIYNHSKILNPEVRLAYLRLINYYEEEVDGVANELHYLYKLSDLDNELKKNEVSLHKSIFREYEIPNLISRKEALISELESFSSYYRKLIPTLSISLLALLIFGGFQYWKRKRAMNRFYVLLESHKIETLSPPTKIENIVLKINELPKATEEKIVQDLINFENNYEYLNSKLTIQKLAKGIDTNSRYLSIVVNHYKKQSFTNYINELRIHYAIEKLKNNSKFRKFTIKAISEEAGFNNAESFSKAFQKFSGIKPSFFIKQLDNQEIKDRNS